MSEQEISRRHDKSRFNKRPSKNSLSRHADITSILFPFKACWRAVIQKKTTNCCSDRFRTMAAVAGALMDPVLSVSAVDVQPISESRITTITDWKHMEMLFPARSDMFSVS